MPAEALRRTVAGNGVGLERVSNVRRQLQVARQPRLHVGSAPGGGAARGRHGGGRLRRCVAHVRRRRQRAAATEYDRPACPARHLAIAHGQPEVLAWRVGQRAHQGLGEVGARGGGGAPERRRWACGALGNDWQAAWEAIGGAGAEKARHRPGGRCWGRGDLARAARRPASALGPHRKPTGQLAAALAHTPAKPAPEKGAKRLALPPPARPRMA